MHILLYRNVPPSLTAAPADLLTCLDKLMTLAIGHAHFQEVRLAAAGSLLGGTARFNVAPSQMALPLPGHTGGFSLAPTQFCNTSN